MKAKLKDQFEQENNVLKEKVSENEMKILDLDNNNKLLANKNDTLTKSLDKYEEDYSELLNVYFI